MLAKDIMVTPVYKVKHTDSVREVLERFVQHRISGMPVVNERNEIVGYISDGDIMRHIGNPGPILFDVLFYTAMIDDPEAAEDKFKRLLKKNVTEIATQKVIAVQENTDLGQVAAILGNKRIKKVPVERRGVLVGIISRGDMIRAFSNRCLDNE